MGRRLQDRLRGILNMAFTKNLGRYLGVPLFTSRPTKGDFAHVLAKIQGNLANWKVKLINMAGRNTLI